MEKGKGIKNLTKTFTERVMPTLASNDEELSPIDTWVEHERDTIDSLIHELVLFAEDTSAHFETTNTTLLIENIRNRNPHLQALLLNYSHRYKSHASYINQGLTRLYRVNDRLLFWFIEYAKRTITGPYNFVVLSKLLSMLLGKTYVLNKIPHTLNINLTQWR